jgi:iron complex transport system substrate-binding protein
MENFLKLVIIFVVGFGVAQEGYQVPGFPPFDSEPRLLEVLERTDDTVRVRHAFGELDVPANPQRIVAGDEVIFGMLVSLGIKPMAVVDFWGTTKQPPLDAYMEGVILLPNAHWSINLEATLTLEPDLIIAQVTLQENNEAFYELVSEIAPTIALMTDGSTSPRQGTRDLAALFGLEAKAEEVIADYEAFAATQREVVREQLGETTISYLGVNVGGLDLFEVGNKLENTFTPHAVTDILYLDLRLEPGPEVVKYGDGFTFSPELLPELQADHLALMVFDNEALSDLESSPLWSQVRAVQEGNVHVFTYEDDSMYVSCGVICNRYRLELFVERLLGQN